MNTCKIISDLLPLYKEDLLTEESIDFVEAHIESCQNCKKDLDSFNIDLINENHSTNPLDFIKENIKKEKNNFGLSVGLIVASLFIVLFSFLTKPIHFDNNGNLYKVKKIDDKIFIEFNDKVTKVDTIIYDNEQKETFVDAYTNIIDKLFKNDRPIILSFNSDDGKLYYDNHNKPANRIIGHDSENSGVELLPRLALNYYFVLAIALFLMLFIIFFILKYIFKKTISTNILIYFLGLPLSFILGFLSIKGFNGVSYYMTRDFIFICLQALAYYLLMISIMKLKISK